jgi:hypothetical protein
MSCEFCNKPYKSIHGVNGSIMYLSGISPYGKRPYSSLHIMSYSGALEIFDVEYCPCCGRKLKNKELQYEKT